MKPITAAITAAYLICFFALLIIFVPCALILNVIVKAAAYAWDLSQDVWRYIDEKGKILDKK